MNSKGIVSVVIELDAPDDDGVTTHGWRVVMKSTATDEVQVLAYGHNGPGTKTQDDIEEAVAAIRNRAPLIEEYIGTAMDMAQANHEDNLRGLPA